MHGASGTLAASASAQSAPPASGKVAKPVSTQPAQQEHEIVVNGAAQRVPVGCSVAELLERLEMGGRRVAVARNRQVVPRSRYDVVALGAGDHVEILEAVGGG